MNIVDDKNLIVIDSPIAMAMSEGCFICGGSHAMRSCIIFDVPNREEGNRILSLFWKGASVEGLESDCYIKVGACFTHRHNLEKLKTLIVAQGCITSEIIEASSSKSRK